MRSADSPERPEGSREDARPRDAVQFGTIALIDALGFKGIWNEKRGGAGNARQTLRAVRAALESERAWAEDHWSKLTGGEYVPGFARTIRFSAHFMSDTAAIAASVQLPKGWQEDPDPHAWVNMVSSATVYVVCRALAPAIRAAALASTPIAYRGAIACGEMDVESDFTVGPAVDDAAAEMESADGAFVWLLPSALEFCRRMQPHEWSHVWERTVELDVPLKGRSFRSRAVNPFIVQEDPSSVDVEQIESAILGTFVSSSVDVAVKRQRTAEFLADARHWVSTSSLAVEIAHAELIDVLKRGGLEAAAETWSVRERSEREQRTLPLPSRFPGTEADSKALVEKAAAGVDPKKLWERAFVHWVEHPPRVP